MTLKYTLIRTAKTIDRDTVRAARPDPKRLAEVVSDSQPPAAAARTDGDESETARERALAVMRHEAVRAEAERRLEISRTVGLLRGVWG